MTANVRGLHVGDGWKVSRRKLSKSERKRGARCARCGGKGLWVWGTGMSGRPETMCDPCDTEYLDSLLDLLERTYP